MLFLHWENCEEFSFWAVSKEFSLPSHFCGQTSVYLCVKKGSFIKLIDFAMSSSSRASGCFSKSCKTLAMRRHAVASWSILPVSHAYFRFGECRWVRNSCGPPKAGEDQKSGEKKDQKQNEANNYKRTSLQNCKGTSKPEETRGLGNQRIKQTRNQRNKGPVGKFIRCFNDKFWAVMFDKCSGYFREASAASA